MKKLLLVLFFLPSMVYSQTYEPLPDSSGIWINEFKTYYLDDDFVAIYDLYNYTNYCTNGIDTIINSENYTRIDTCSGGYKGAFRNDLGKVYFVPRADSLEYLLYDFTANDGDTLYDVYQEDGYNESYLADLVVSVPALDTILIDDAYRKFIYAGDAQWIEGIGCSAGLFKNSGNNISMFFIELFCHSASNKTLYPSWTAGDSPCYLYSGISNDHVNSISIFPNPTTGILTMKFIPSNDKLMIGIYDLLGELVYEKQLVPASQIAIDLSFLKPGNYILSAQLGNSFYREKVVKL